jgi:hypothetical protein
MMGRSIRILVITITFFLLYVTGLALLSSRAKTESNLYIDDVVVTVDQKNLYDLSFMEETQSRLPSGQPVYETLVRGAHVCTKEHVVYTGDEYASPPMSLGFLTGAEYGVGLVIKDSLAAGWDEFTVSYMMKDTGVPPSTLYCRIGFDNGGGLTLFDLGEKDYLTGESLWHVYAGWANADGSLQSSRGNVPWDWSSWHKVDVVFSRSLHSFSLILDGDTLYSGRFDPRLGSVFLIEMHKN